DFRASPHEFRDREFATLADSMNHAARQLDSYDKDQKTFFQNASHELRTPLTSITCYAEGISCGIMEPVAASQTILVETARLTGMVEDLLAVSRLDSLGGERKTVTCDLAVLLNAAADEQRTVASERGIAIVPAEVEAPVVIAGDDVALHQAFANLLSNAIRHARSQVVLGCEDEGGDAVVTVSDDGTGIGPDDLPHIFERFYKGPGGSHGIGLAIVKSVAEYHGGRVEVASGETGATFRLVLPGGATPGRV
ncbi:MAG: HAMP domain-containing histidine kinase, partial [Actinomycetia bacterium]|nr:HAMP domain-containing histidine kinase [Actinomycetes bacterium]